MNKKIIVCLLAVAAVLGIVFVAFFVKKTAIDVEQESGTEEAISAFTETEKETETEAIVVNSEEERTESEKQSIAESAIPDETVLNNSSNEETSAAETEKSSVENESRYQNLDKELESATVTVSSLPETNTDEQGKNDIKGNSTEGENRDTSNSAIYGDTGEKYHYPCDESYYAPVIHSLCEPGWYSGESALDVYEQVFVLSDQYKKEHPFSAGSILKPYYPDIDDVYWFTGSFDKRYIVLKAYDTSNVKKYFRIRFTITENYELDTVTVEELSDDDVAE